ncbi:hypothetical protein [Acinetobacter pittii]|uniref:hypothetical protein n=1 Tax=Acinetobacter pittii TaxID=48296 RepID=UPI001901A62E|nr:hypothetical protein [Acinetobacter pittii]
MTQKLIKFGFDFHSQLLMDEILQALKFCPVQYDIEQISEKHYFFEVSDSKAKLLILNFINDFYLRKELNAKIAPEQKSFVDAIIRASISK